MRPSRARRALSTALDAAVQIRCNCDRSIGLSASNLDDASKRGEPLREGRLWRSRRSGRRGRVRGVGSTLTDAPCFPLRRRDLRHAEALRAAAHPASRTNAPFVAANSTGAARSNSIRGNQAGESRMDLELQGKYALI